jgi:hypothetical protein
MAEQDIVERLREVAERHLRRRVHADAVREGIDVIEDLRRQLAERELAKIDEPEDDGMWKGPQ